ncbi:hypothetical protein GQ600_21021 [Phytophthora cactorum]|nr:hypothetical protein GQ600_3800 [Phytophthora cactorum]KAF1783468.1 hypothetical protein GQ600_21021 [Phytophthora cactorum]
MTNPNNYDKCCDSDRNNGQKKEAVLKQILEHLVSVGIQHRDSAAVREKINVFNSRSHPFCDPLDVVQNLQNGTGFIREYQSRYFSSNYGFQNTFTAVLDLTNLAFVSLPTVNGEEVCV